MAKRKSEDGLSRFTVNGKPLEAVSLPRLVKRIHEYLESLPFGELKRIAEIAVAVGVVKDSVNQHTCNNLIAHNRCSLGYHNIVWGSKETIVELEKELEANAN